MVEISLTQQQVNELSLITATAEGNFFAGYDYLRSILVALSPNEISAMGATQKEIDDRVFWLEKAAAINRNDLSDDANNFIRDVTRYGLLWDGHEVGNLQSNSDGIGRSVIGDIISTGKFDDIDMIIGKDVGAAVENGGQTFAGWGGAFYYWDRRTIDSNDELGSGLID